MLVELTVIAAIVCIAILIALRWAYRFSERMKRERCGETVDTFLTHCKRRGYDERVAVEVYRAVQDMWDCMPFASSFPLRGADSIVNDVRIDGEEVPDLISRICERLGRRWEISNGDVLPDTVEGLVEYVSRLPSVSAADS